MRKYNYFSLVIVVVLALSSLSFAGFSITPSISVGEKYNDNLFLEPTDIDSDFITTFSPTINLQYNPNRHFDLSLDYGLNFRFYADHDELNDTSFQDTQFADLTAQVRPLDFVFVDITDSYRRVPVDVREVTAPDNDSVNMTDSNGFEISPYVEFPLTSTIMARFGYRYINKWYKVDNGNDAYGNGVFATVSREFPFGLNISLDYDFLAYRPEITSNYDRQLGMVSVSYQAGPYLIIQGGYGKTYIDLVDTSRRIDTWNAGADYKIVALGDATLGIHYDVSLSDAEFVAGTRTEGWARGFLVDDAISISTGITKTSRIDLIFTVINKYEVTLNPFYTLDEELETTREDQVKGVNAEISKPLTPNFIAGLDASWQRQEFLPEEEKVRFYSLGSTIEYLVSRSITTSVGYRHNERNSNINSGDYHNNIVFLEATVIF